jgi:hypothetical protein
MSSGPNSGQIRGRWRATRSGRSGAVAECGDGQRRACHRVPRRCRWRVCGREAAHGRRIVLAPDTATPRCSRSAPVWRQPLPSSRSTSVTSPPMTSVTGAVCARGDRPGVHARHCGYTSDRRGPSAALNAAGARASGSTPAGRSSVTVLVCPVRGDVFAVARRPERRGLVDERGPYLLCLLSACVILRVPRVVPASTASLTADCTRRKVDRSSAVPAGERGRGQTQSSPSPRRLHAGRVVPSGHLKPAAAIPTLGLPFWATSRPR